MLKVLRIGEVIGMNDCWYCKNDGVIEDLVFDSEFDAFVHKSCVVNRLNSAPSDPEANIIALSIGVLTQEQYDYNRATWDCKAATLTENADDCGYHGEFKNPKEICRMCWDILVKPKEVKEDCGYCGDLKDPEVMCSSCYDKMVRESPSVENEIRRNIANQDHTTSETSTVESNILCWFCGTSDSVEDICSNCWGENISEASQC